jgi:hypothetical protein
MDFDVVAFCILKTGALQKDVAIIYHSGHGRDLEKSL